MKLSINAKIFGVAALLLLACTAVAVASFLRVRLVNQEVVSLAKYYVPLSRTLSSIEIAIRDQEIYLQTQLDVAAQKAVHPDDDKLRLLGEKVDKGIAAAVSLAQNGMTSAQQDNDRIKFAQLVPMLQNIQQQHQTYEDRAKAYLDDRQMSGDARVLADWIAQERANLNQALDRLDGEIAQLAEASAWDAAEQETAALRANFLITLLTTLFGLLLAYWLTRSILKPLHRLVEGTNAVEKGNLDIRLAVTSEDEIGALTRSFNAMVVELRTKERIKSMLGKYIDPRIAEELIAQADHAVSDGKREVMSVLFSDIKGFSLLSEELTPSNMVNLLNRYFTTMALPVTANSGVIDKYIGDAMMAFWGPPFASKEQHARLACCAALAKLEALKEFRQELPEIVGLRKGLAEFDIRIGIATGEVIVGSIGSDMTRVYTVVGDTVNLASRLEGVNKVYGTHILINEAACQLAGDGIETRELDLVMVAGKEEPVRIYELLSLTGLLDENQSRLRSCYGEALGHYRRGEWREAQTGFEQCLTVDPLDGPSRVMRDRVIVFQTSPPDGWDGIWRMTQK